MASHTMFSNTTSSSNSERPRPKSASSTMRKKRQVKRATEDGGNGYDSSTNAKPAPLSPYSSHKERNPRAQDSDFFEDGTSLKTFGKMGKEELLEAIYQAKKAAIASDIIASNLRAENKRWENEVLKQQRRMDRLLESMATGNKGAGSSSSEEVRREIEKSILVRQLKQQITILKTTVGEKDMELERAKKSQKSSKLLELSNENYEYLGEVARLKEVVKRLHDNLTAERRVRKQESAGRLGGGSAQKASSVLENFGGFRTEQARDEINRFMGGYEHAYATTDGGRSSSQAGSGQSRRPHSATSVRAAPAADSAAPPAAERPSSSLPANASPVRRSNPPPEELPARVEQPAAPALIAPAKPEEAAASGAPTEMPADSANRVGDRVYGMFLGGRVWYNATVTACRSGGLCDLLYDDGDRERDVPPARLRPIEQPAPAAALAQTAAAAAAPGSAFKVGDEVEAFYYNGSTMYRAKVLVVYADRASGSFSYDIMYTDGEREKKVHESKIKLFVPEPQHGGGPAKTSAAAPAAAPTAAAPTAAAPTAAAPTAAAPTAAAQSAEEEFVFEDGFDDAFEDFLDGGKAQFLNGSAEYESVEDAHGAAQQDDGDDNFES